MRTQGANVGNVLSCRDDGGLASAPMRGAALGPCDAGAPCRGGRGGSQDGTGNISGGRACAPHQIAGEHDPDGPGRLTEGTSWERYEHQFPDSPLLQFVQSGATCLSGLASAVGAEQEDRTVAAWTITPATAGKRDVSCQRGFPLPPDPDGTLADRGTSHPPSFRRRVRPEHLPAAPGFEPRLTEPGLTVPGIGTRSSHNSWHLPFRPPAV